MRFLRTNTAIRITVGPFLDKTDGITPETALTATNEHLTLMVDDANVPTLVLDANATASGGNNDFVHVTGDDAGFYDLELTAANLNYLGRAMLSINYVTDHCPVFHEFMILPAVIYDAMVLGTDLFDVSMTQILGTAVSTPATAGILDVNLKNIANAAVSTSSAQLGVNVVNVGGTAQTAGDIIGDTNDIQSRLPAALSGDGFIKADMKSIDDELTSGNNATLNLKNLNIINNSGDAFVAQSTNGGRGIVASGDIAGGIEGVYIEGGYGIILQGMVGEGLVIDSATTGAVLIAPTSSGDPAHGIRVYGEGGGKSIYAPQDIAVSDGSLTLAAIASAVWASATRTLTSIADSAGVTTLLSRITAALGIYTAADVRSAVGLASANLDTQLDTLPTAAENATAVLSAAASNPIDANVQEVNDVALTGDGSTTPWGPA